VTLTPELGGTWWKVKNARICKRLEKRHVTTSEVKSRIINGVVATSLLVVKTCCHLKTFKARAQQMEPHQLWHCITVNLKLPEWQSWQQKIDSVWRCWRYGTFRGTTLFLTERWISTSIIPLSVARRNMQIRHGDNNIWCKLFGLACSAFRKTALFDIHMAFYSKTKT